MILHLRVGNAQEPVGVEAFFPEAFVERFDEGIIGRLPRNASLIGPDAEIVVSRAGGGEVVAAGHGQERGVQQQKRRSTKRLTRKSPKDVND